MRLILLAAIAAVFFVSPALAECTGQWIQHDRLVGQISSNYKEKLIAIAIAKSTPWGHGLVTEIYSSDTTWTAILTHPNGCAIPILEGYAWENLVVEKGEGL